MEPILAVAAVIGVATITPGPNNFIVMSAASRRGYAAALPAIAGIVSGSTLLLVLAWAGAAAIFDLVPGLRSALMLAGAGYLVWLGGMLVKNASTRLPDERHPENTGLPTTFLAVAIFQFFNPKAWVLVLTAIATIAGPFSETATLAILVPLTVAIPIVCLSVWALGGVALTLWMEDGIHRKRFDMAMGGLLMVSAIFLVL